MRFLSYCAIIASISPWCITAQPALAPSPEAKKDCRIVRSGLMVPCPEGWNILDDNDREAVISNFPLTSDVTKNTRSGKGKATIAVSTLPKLYRSLSEWIFAGHKNAPDAVETKFVTKNSTGIDVPVVCLSAPQSPGPLYASYFFQIGKTPVLIELNYRADDPLREEYKAAVRRMITTAVASR
jgi:hypothetical protein